MITSYYALEDIETRQGTGAARTGSGDYAVWAQPNPGTFNDRKLVRRFEGPEAEKPARELVDKLNAEERARVLAAPVTRYQTNWYCAISEEEARRLAEIDKTTWAQVRITPGLTIVQNTNSWALWSDGKFSKKVSELAPFGTLPRAATKLINDVRGADGGCVYLPNGLLALTKVAEIRSETEVNVGPSRGYYAPEKIVQMAIKWTDGTTGDVYIHTAGYFEGYMFNVYSDLKEARKAAILASAPGPNGLTADDLAGSRYDPELGFITD